MAKNVIIMIGDGMGWEMARTAATANTGEFYTSGAGEGLSFQELEGYSFVTTYGTTVAPGSEELDPTKRLFSTGNGALYGSGSNPTGTNPLRPDFEFVPDFNPGISASGEAPNPGTTALGNLVGYDAERGGLVPWDASYYDNRENPAEGFDPEYIKYSYPDSANTATTLYTGVKSYNNAIGVDIYEEPLESVLQMAADQGKSTGLVTSVPIDHATPGAAAANVNRRNKYDSDFPTLDSILQQELRIYRPNVLLGGGHPFSNTQDPLPDGVEPPTDNTFITESTYAELSANPTDNVYDYTFLERGPDAAMTLADTAAEIDPNQGERLLGLYGARGQNGNLPVSSADGDYSTTGLDMFSLFSSAQETGIPTPDTERPLLPGETDESFIATEVNENPTLTNLTDAALEVLGKDEDGFWLMIEGGDIDWSAHDNNVDNLIGTVNDFDKAVQSVTDWIAENGGWEENLLIVTADHDHYLTLNPEFPELLATEGAEALTFEQHDPETAGHFWGSDDAVKYGWGSHSNRPVPVYYQGAGSEVLDGLVGEGYTNYGFEVPGFSNGVDQSHIFQTMAAAVTGTDNYLNGSPNAETFIGEDDQNDLIVSRGENDTVAGGLGDDQIYGGYGNDLLRGDENTRASGTEGGNDKIFGGVGNDRISGKAGNDELYGEEGNDRIWGDAGDDLIDGGLGNDRLYGDAGDMVGGVDTFVLRAGDGKDTIYDFELGIDFIGLSDGLMFSELVLNTQGQNTLIQFGTETLAVVQGVVGLSESNFALV
ncbi:MAG: alkaline phosphatase [Microcoleaceae cyanobacterium]